MPKFQTDNDKLPVIKIREMDDGITSDTEFVKGNIPEAIKVYDGDVLFSWCTFADNIVIVSA